MEPTNVFSSHFDFQLLDSTNQCDHLYKFLHVLSRSKVPLPPHCKKSKPAVEIKERGRKKYLLEGRKMSSSRRERDN